MKSKKIKKTISLLLVLAMIMNTTSGCSSSNHSTNANGTNTVSAASGSTDNEIGVNTPITDISTITEKLKEEDTDNSWNASDSTQITLKDTTAEVSGEGASVSGNIVTIQSAGTYVISGTLSKGQIRIEASKDDLVRLVLNGVDMTSDKNAAIYASTADKLVIILADGTTNKIADTASYTYEDTEKEEPNASIFSKCDLSINGTGSLTVNGNFKHGIVTKDDLVIAEGNITVKAVKDALRGKDSVTIADGVMNLTSTEGDGIKTNNETDEDKGFILITGGKFYITAANDGIQASTILQIEDGTFEITTGGGWPGGSLKRGSHAANNDDVVSATNPDTGSYKGLKGDKNIVIEGGTFQISSYDDAVHSNGNVSITGGTITIQSGLKGIHADNTINLNGGSVDIKNSYEGIEGAYINVDDGKITCFSTDDGININHSSGLLTISGGDVYINASSDGLDSNNNIVMTGGTVYIDGPTTSNDGAIDYQNQFDISGGVLIAADCGNMLEAPSTSSEQPSILLYYTNEQKAGTEIVLQSADGTILASYAPQKDYKAVVISAPDMKLNETYSIYSDSTKLCDVTLSSSVTTIDDTGAVATGRMSGPGGMGGGQGDMGERPGGMGDGQRPDGQNMPQRPEEGNE